MTRYLLLAALFGSLTAASAHAQQPRRPAPMPVAPPPVTNIGNIVGLPNIGNDNFVPNIGNNNGLQKTWKLGVQLTSTNGGPSVVTQVFDGSPAARIGLRVGDELATVNGELANDPNRVRDQVFAHNRVAIVLRRDGGYYQTDVEFETVTVVTETTAYASKVVKSVVTAPTSAPRR